MARSSDGWPQPLTAVFVVVGTVGMALVAVAGAMVGPRGPAGSVLVTLFGAARPSGGTGTAVACIVLVVGLVLILGAWLILGLRLRAGASLRPLLAMAVAWAVPMMVVPPIYSRDVYSYAAIGRMWNLHLNPYHVGPSALGSSHFVDGVGTAWMHTPSPYGPLFVAFASRVVWLSGGSVALSVFMFRLVALASLAAIAVTIPTLALRAGKDPARALWLSVCNPIVIVHVIGGAHNDAMMVAIVLVGVVIAGKRPMLGMLVCMIAATIKLPAMLAAVFIAVDAIRDVPPRRRWREAITFVLAAAGTFAAAASVTGLGWGWIGALGIPGTNHLLLTPTTATAHLVSVVVGHDSSVLAATRILGDALIVAVVSYLVWRAPSLGTTRAIGLALVAVVALGPILLPWYALWPVIVLAAAGTRLERGYAIVASVLLTIIEQPSGAALPDLVLLASITLLVALAVAIVSPPLRHWIRQRLAPTIDAARATGLVPLRPQAVRQLLQLHAHTAITDS